MNDTWTCFSVGSFLLELLFKFSLKSTYEMILNEKASIPPALWYKEIGTNSIFRLFPW